MKLSLVINGVAREVDTEHIDAQIVEAEPGLYSVLKDGRSYEARIEAGEGGMRVFIEGHRFEIEVRDPRRWSRKAAGQGIHGRISVTAPMPGKVVRLLAAVGDSVAGGQGLLVVEAMKMQNEIKAPKPGKVVSIQAKEGATVAAGEILAAIE
jgi:biotin carboxyl carrier protein